MPESIQSVDREDEREIEEMTSFWRRKATTPGPPDPRPTIEKISTLIVIHRLAQALPADQARKVQRANFDAFKDIARV